MLCDAEVNELSTFVINDEKAAKDVKGGSWDVEEINAHGIIEVKLEESFPFWRRRNRAMAARHVFGDSGLCDGEAKLEELAVDARSAPAAILGCHCGDQLAQFGIDGRPASVTTLESPEETETRAMPANNGLWTNEGESGLP